jgi:hypothetical protein
MSENNNKVSSYINPFFGAQPNPKSSTRSYSSSASFLTPPFLKGIQSTVADTSSIAVQSSQVSE